MLATIKGAYRGGGHRAPVQKMKLD